MRVVMAVITGALSGSLIYVLVFLPWLQSLPTFLVFVILGIIGDVLFALKYTETFDLGGSAFIGAYAFCRGFSLLVGGFINELLLGYYLANADIFATELEVGSSMYMYIIGIAGLTAWSWWYQYRNPLSKDREAQSYIKEDPNLFESSYNKQEA